MSEDTTPSVLPSTLSAAQAARIEGLQAARAVLVAHTLVGTAKAEAWELVAVARYIETGRDPFDSESE